MLENDTPARRPPGTSLVPAIVFGAIGVPFAAWAFWLLAERLVIALRWPEARATVTDSKVETRGSQYAARIRVRFETPGGVVETEVAHDHRFGGHATIAEAVELYPKGSEAGVRYAPLDPRRARLEAGFNLETFGLPLVLVAAAASFGGIGLLAFQSARLQRAGAERQGLALTARFVWAVGVAFLVCGFAMLPGALERRRWPRVTATVDRVDVYARSDTGPGKHRSRTTRYVVREHLAYQHAGRMYFSPLLAGSHRSRQDALRIANGVPRGAPREIRADPNHPHRIDRVDSWPLALPGIFFGTGLLVWWIARLLLRRYAR